MAIEKAENRKAQGVKLLSPDTYAVRRLCIPVGSFGKFEKFGIPFGMLRERNLVPVARLCAASPSVRTV